MCLLFLKLKQKKKFKKISWLSKKRIYEYWNKKNIYSYFSFVLALKIVDAKLLFWSMEFGLEIFEIENFADRAPRTRAENLDLDF